MQWSGIEKEPEVSLPVQWVRLCTSTARGMGAASFAKRKEKEPEFLLKSKQKYIRKFNFKI